MASETEPILGERRAPNPLLSFNGNRPKLPITFRCCFCSVLIVVIIVILATTILYSVMDPSRPPEEVTGRTWPVPDEELALGEPPNAEEVEDAVNFGRRSMAERGEFEETLPKMEVDSPSFRHQLSMKTSERARRMAEYGLILEMGTRQLANRSCGKRLPISKAESLPAEICKQDSRVCEIKAYRSADGSCNNLKHDWGTAMTRFRRILPADYSDGISAPKVSRTGTLPGAREVSLKIHRALYIKDLDFTVMLAVWGQFVDHDMTATALSQGKNGKPITCCGTEPQHPECFPVALQEDDPFYQEYNVTCMDFVRSAPAPVCGFGPREHINQMTSFIDGSAIYGASEELMNELRSFTDGEMKMLLGPSGEELLPVSTEPNDGCNREEELKRGRYCFLTGDPRANENLHLTSMHLIFSRQHNSLARKLRQLNPHWKDQRLFQEARKILTAQIQHITYNEFLPAILPKNLMITLNLTVRPNGYFRRYDESVNPSIANGFASAAFRFGHSLLPGLLKMIANDSSSKEFVELHKMLFNPFGLYDEGFLENAIRGALNTSVEKSDVYFNKEISGELFRKKGPCGLDLVSLNIQRGRDHGLPGYPKWRSHYGFSKVETFDDLTGIFDEDSINKVRDLYSSVADIDLFTGGLAEIPMNGSLLGPTFTHLIADQFLRLKLGDRFWYETHLTPQTFTPDQLREIKKTTLARIICDNSHITESQPMVMRRVNRGNQRRPCRRLAAVNLETWREN